MTSGTPRTTTMNLPPLICVSYLRARSFGTAPADQRARQAAQRRPRDRAFQPRQHGRRQRAGDHDGAHARDDQERRADQQAEQAPEPRPVPAPALA